MDRFQERLREWMQDRDAVQSARYFAEIDDFTSFKKMLPEGTRDQTAENIYQRIKEGKAL